MLNFQPIQEKKIFVTTDIIDDISIQADPFFLSIIIDNLFSNAIKYAAVNGEVHYSWNSETKTFTITNDGIEINQEQLPYLFDRFYRTDDSRNSLIPGSGLGLAIVKKLADLQNIGINVSTTPGSTSFSLQFPS